jgi:hypothetical protein
MDPAAEPLEHVPVEDRVEVASFERESEGRLAAGLLRANGIACQLDAPTVPGLTWQQSLWVGSADAPAARDLLASPPRPELVD